VKYQAGIHWVCGGVIAVAMLQSYLDAVLQDADYASVHRLGLPGYQNAALTGEQADAAFGQEFFGAPLTMEAETYESFTERFLGRSHQEAQAEVNEELRRLQIDPEVFYRNAQRLRLSQYAPDDMDPTALPGRERRGGERPLKEEETSSSLPRWADTARALSELTGTGADEALHQKLVEASDAPAARSAPTLNVPEHGMIEEIALDEIGGETYGGRLGRETPRGLESSLQIDSLTDDEAEFEDFVLGPVVKGHQRRAAALAAQRDGAADGAASEEEGDTVETFSLDPEFDYDNVNLTSRVQA